METVIDTVPAASLEIGDLILTGSTDPITWVNEDASGDILVWVEGDDEPFVFDPDQRIALFGMVYDVEV
jgi:hypothetical protein